MEDASSRRARLKSLREDARAAEQAEVQPDEAASGALHIAEPVLKFRNYTPRDERLEHQKVEAAHVPEFEEDKVDQDVLTSGANEAEILAPKKANWDVQRDIEPKLALLERETQAAMITLMQQEGV